MSLPALLDAFTADLAVIEVLRTAGRQAHLVEVSIAPGGRAMLLAALTQPAAPTASVSAMSTVTASATASPPRTVLAVTSTGRQAEDLAAALRCFLPPERVTEFPSWETLPHERLSPRSDTVGRRLATLRRLAHPDPADAAYGRVDVVVASVRAVLQPIARGLGDLEPVALHVGDQRPLDSIVEALAAAAYVRTDLVERRGEFAVRGGILDVFPPTEEHPLRVELFGDEVEDVRYFKVADQRSLDAAAHGLWAPPCREVLLTPAVRTRAAELAGQLPGVADMLHKVAEGIAVEGMESLGPALLADSGGMQPLLDVLPSGAMVVVVDPERVRTRAHDLVATSEEFLEASWFNAAAGNAVPVDLQGVLGQASYAGLAQLRQHAVESGLPWWTLATFAADSELNPTAPPTKATATTSAATTSAATTAAATTSAATTATTMTASDERAAAGGALALEVPSEDVPEYRSDTKRATADLRGWNQQGWSVVVVTEGHGLATRVGELLSDRDIPNRLLSGVPAQGRALEPGVVHITTGSLGRGVLLPASRLAVVTEADLTGGSGTGPSTRDMRKMPSRRRNMVDPLQLRPGDHVVHEQHGVGRFVQMMQRTVGGATREYLVLEYASSRRGQPPDQLFVPTDQLDQVTKYVGGEAPTLNKLGGSDWARTKGRARKHVRQIAGELIRLYSARMATSGYAFGPDTPWQRELEDAFAYVETPDQLSSIEEVKADMEKPVPMDRLICGDVGYGKTEIAVRAAFKAIQDGKQVAVLCPTTLLVQQHMQTFTERFAPFPVRVGALSRFQSDAQARAVLAGLAEGSVDLVIGTHRLLSGSVKFKDIGLIVVDEEQRFGVEHKEQLKALRTSVDVLAMSATPIPRTLEMAVTGIREMSTLATPPEERHPVLTFVGSYEEKQVSAAIRRELMREGQVFLVHNKVTSIERAATRLRELVPEARVATAHGQMPEHRLEQVVLDFWERRFDVLVCTTIVENGLDISNANTLVVERADVLGLSQLHQLRGRVGRGRERAYSYFLFPPDKPLTETAADRLETIASNNDLGSGIAIAMKDLEIRGAGNLLGGEQSGHIAGVGFDLYVRLVGEAVADFRGEGDKAPVEIKIELPVDAHLPHDYVPGERLRLEAYKKLAAVEHEEALAQIEAELLDRYGAPPEPVRNLLEVARLRTFARRAGIADISVQGRHIRFGPVELRESRRLRLERLYPGTLVKDSVRTVLVPRPVTARVGGQPLRDRAVLDWAGSLIRAVLLDDVASAAAIAGSAGSTRGDTTAATGARR